MIISCPECSGKFRIDASALGAGGRTVRCGKCGHTWLQTPPDPSADSQAGTEIGPGIGNATDPVPADAGSRGQAGEADALDEDGGESDEAIDWDAPAERDDDDIRVRARRRGGSAVAAQAKSRWPAVAAWAGLVVVVAGLGAGLLVFRANVMNTWPETSGLYDGLDLARPGFGLVLAPPRARQTEIDGATALVIEGRIENPTSRARDIPKMLKLQLLDKDQHELQTRTFAAPATRLLPEQSVAYRFELKDPAEKRDILLITFVEEDK
jgi:predicted Zn finger-like uncharacterized protein